MKSCSEEEMLTGILQHRIERWLELEGVFTLLGFGAGELDWEPGAGLVYLRRLDDNQVWRVDIAMTARPATREEASSRWYPASAQPPATSGPSQAGAPGQEPEQGP